MSSALLKYTLGLAALSTCFSPVHAFPKNPALFEKAACTRLINPIKNGNFESGSLAQPPYYQLTTGPPKAPWKVNKDYPNGAASLTLQPGDNSKHSAQLLATANIANFFQNITLCKGAAYEVSWSQYQVPKAEKYPKADPNSLNLFVDVIDPNGESFGPVDFQMHLDYYTQGGDPGVKHPAGQWRNYSFEYTVQQSGSGALVFEFYAADAGVSGEWRFDNIAMKLQS